MNERADYQPELDGLRALAVVGVLLCHLDLKWAAGGFVGVDVFFVLSGFLITRLIAAEVSDTGRFSFGRFYLRRVRRLYPALCATVVMAAIGSFLLLSPAEFQQFARSAISALLSVSNFEFFAQSNYFDALADTKPLLHTWSLSVEEQFYLVWPLLMVLLLGRFGRRGAVAGLLVVTVASLALAQYWLGRSSAAAFYLLPARAVELAIGALLVFAPPIGRRWLGNVSAGLGIVVIVLAMALFTADTPFPGLAALLPCAGAALFILGSRSAVAGLLRLPPIVGLGRISYSLYLVHWPLIVLWKAYTFRPLTMVDALAIIALSLGLAIAQYLLVEQRFRRPVPGRNGRVIVGLGALASLVMVTSGTAATGDGWQWRVPAERQVISDSTWRQIQANEYCSSFNPALDRDLITCQNFRHKPRDIYIWGDSHAQHLVAGFSDAYPDYNIYVLYMSECSPQSGSNGFIQKIRNSRTDDCVARNKAALEYFDHVRNTNVVLTGYKRSTPETIYASSVPLLKDLREEGHTAVLLGDFNQPGESLVDCSAVPAFVVSDEMLRKRCTGVKQVVAKDLAFNQRLHALAADFVDVNDLQCPNGQCTFYDGRRLLFRDQHHLNADGSKFFVRKLKPLLPFR